jgi:phosphate-selective porin OprO/OprP
MMSRTLTSFLLLILFASDLTIAQTVDPHNVLIRDVKLLDAEGADVAANVSILIRDDKLDLVTKGEFPTPEGVLSIDARGGFLLGDLKVGKQPSFIILNEDPRVNFDVLLDTEEHAVFAIHKGSVRKNTLYQSFDEPETIVADETGRSPRGWVAYSPPPMMLPMSYQDGNKWNQWDSKYVNGIFLAAVVLDRQHWLQQDSDSIDQVGELSLYDGGQIRGLRFGAVGTINLDTPLIYTLFGATNAFDKGFDTEMTDDFAWFDWRLDIPLPKRINLSLGKQREPISLERLTSMINLPMQERTSVSDALMPSRNVGVVVSGSALNSDVTWAGGLFNDWLDDDGSAGSNSTQAIGRLTWLPWYNLDESNLIQLGVGVRIDNAKEALRYATEPEFNSAPLYVDSGDITANGSSLYNLEANWRRGPYWLSAEYVRNSIDAPLFGDPTFTGYHVTGSWVVSGEMRAFNRKNALFRPVPVARSVYQGGWGAWELSTRFSRIDLTDGLVNGGEMDIFSIGANWWLSPFFNVNMNYRYIMLDKGGVSGNSSGILARIMLVLE